ncbi:polysaccharide deacetylase family protein [Shewanella eurypsychrophilus]|uniref:Polysaccharide deacetylase family protein n=1 Tax=Shewanella eurypsychrophilus TaxID=2593656 RepID=A0ABX6V0L3_9GAMM|nr:MULTISPECIES: polysaccharide deacetylase family protein [Shewanella]QFU20585.1 polysaccharide deacetylase family protein [Shewanella sp. YLB-09]QFU20866.1 polysaccharide deacetylase family protein [Shewanella sp. YLB-09]QPG56155.1 polysaccharide deacetylase family protein [Shewanella eurypsychrophilus]
MFKNILITLLVLFSLSLQAFTAQAAVILQYHHVSASTPAITSVTPVQFKEQMQYLADNDFIVMPLSQVVDAIRNQQPIAENAIVITFDDGYKSIANTAHPILKEYGYPYTLFVSVEPIKAKYSEMMSWEELIQLSKEGAEIANHSWGHEHLIRKLAGESESQWLTRIEANILKTEAEIKQATGQNHKMLAYPYGEYNQAIETMLSRHGFVGLGQQSGAAGAYSPITALPRFPVAGVYADLSSLKVKMHSLNMPVVSMTPRDPELKEGHWRPELKVTLDMSDIYPHQLMCFIQGQGAKKPLWLSETEFSVRAELDLPPGRSRYNCTAPSKSQTGYYWFSQAWVRPKNDGTWIEE